MKSQMMDSNYLANNHTIPWKLRNHVGFTSSNTFWVPEIDKKNAYISSRQPGCLMMEISIVRWVKR